MFKRMIKMVVILIIVNITKEKKRIKKLRRIYIYSTLDEPCANYRAILPGPKYCYS